MDQLTIDTINTAIPTLVWMTYLAIVVIVFLSVILVAARYRKAFFFDKRSNSFSSSKTMNNIGVLLSTVGVCSYSVANFNKISVTDLLTLVGAIAFYSGGNRMMAKKEQTSQSGDKSNDG